MSILAAAKPPLETGLVATICGHPGSGKTTLACTFGKSFLIRTKGEGMPRDIPADMMPDSLDETDSAGSLFDQMIALLREPHDYQTLIVDSVSGLDDMFIRDVLDRDKDAKNIQTAHGGYGAGRDMVTSMHWRVRRAAEHLRKKRGMNTIFIAHTEISRVEPPDSDSYTQWGLKLHHKSVAPYVDQVDLVGFLREDTAVTGKERKRAVGSGDRVLVTYLTPTAVTKNRFGIRDDLQVSHLENPLLGLIPGLPGAKPAKKAKTAAKPEDNAVAAGEEESTDSMMENGNE